MNNIYNKNFNNKIKNNIYWELDKFNYIQINNKYYCYNNGSKILYKYIILQIKLLIIIYLINMENFWKIKLINMLILDIYEIIMQNK